MDIISKAATRIRGAVSRRTTGSDGDEGDEKVDSKFAVDAHDIENGNFKTPDDLEEALDEEKEA